MRCSICSSALDHAGDNMYYCPKCRKMFNENETYYNENMNYNNTAYDNNMADVYDTARDTRFEEPDRTVYEDKSEFIDETKPQKFGSIEVKDNAPIRVAPELVKNVIPKTKSAQAIIFLVLSFIFEILLPVAIIISFKNASSLKNPPPDCNNAAEYKKSYTTCILCGVIGLIFLIVSVVVLGLFAYINTSVIR